MNIDSKRLYKEYYKHMFTAVQNGDTEQANQFRTQMEQLRQSCILSRPQLEYDSKLLPPFAQSNLNKNHHDLNIKETSNCINAAFNFHCANPTFTPYTTMDFLKIIRTDFIQLQSEPQFGDLVVFWSRVNDMWKDRRISIDELLPDHPDFPFGLVFDHIAVYVGAHCLYHKPDPRLESRYQINHWDDVVGFSELVDGFELTFHRKK